MANRHWTRSRGRRQVTLEEYEVWWAGLRDRHNAWKGERKPRWSEIPDDLRMDEAKLRNWRGYEPGWLSHYLHRLAHPHCPIACRWLGGLGAYRDLFMPCGNHVNPGETYCGQHRRQALHDNGK